MTESSIDAIIEKINITLETGLFINRKNEAEEEKKKTEEFIKYFCANIEKQSRLFRIVWKLNESGKWNGKKDKLNTHIQTKYKVDKRTANSLIQSVIGRKKALLELKKTELSDLKTQQEALNKEIEKIIVEINKIKPIVAINKATEKVLAAYRKNKHSLFNKKRKLNRISHKIKKLEKQINEKRFKICWGTKKLFNAQHWLEENKFDSKAEWRNSFIQTRDNQVNYIGCASEPCGNQNCQLSYCEATDSFHLRVRKDLELMEHKDDKFFIIEGIDFKYQRDKLIELLKRNETPITIRILRRGARWYLQVIITWANAPEQRVTNKDDGVIGLDFNSGFIQMAEADSSGNLIKLRKFQLEHHGTGNKANSEICEVVSEITKYAVTKRKSIVIEDLDFRQKKAKTSRAKGNKGKFYNKMIHSLDYSRYSKTIKNATHRNNTELIYIDPAYTTKIGESKYSKLMKLNSHQAAAFVIARRGMGYIDTVKMS